MHVYTYSVKICPSFAFDIFHIFVLILYICLTFVSFLERLGLMDLLGIWQVYFGKIPSPLRHCTEETGGGQMMFPAVLVKPGVS